MTPRQLGEPEKDPLEQWDPDLHAPKCPRCEKPMHLCGGMNNCAECNPQYGCEACAGDE